MVGARRILVIEDDAETAEQLVDWMNPVAPFYACARRNSREPRNVRSIP
jgi:hypothetical protein